MTEIDPCPNPVCQCKDVQVISGGPGCHYVKCRGCGLQTDDGCRDRQVALWNSLPRAPTAPSGEEIARVKGAIEQLTNHQQQLDMDGTFVGVSRQALDEVLAAIAAMRPAALSDIAAERQRQINAEGWTPDHDDAHGDKSLALAAACYALLGAGYRHGSPPLDVWPWEGQPKAADPRRNLVKAGALIVAEIERLDRAALRQAGEG